MSIRERVIKASASLMARNVLGMIIGTGGVFLLTSTIGPSAYGAYAAVFGIAMYASSIGSFGVSVYLVRKEVDPSPQEFDQAFTLLLVTGVLSAVLLIAALPLLADWMNAAGIEGIAIALFALTPVALAGVVPVAIIERQLNYGRLAIIELIAQVIIYAVALPTAYMGYGSWAPAFGWIAHRIFLSIAYFIVAKYRPRFHWDIALVREMLSYGIRYSASKWTWDLRKLVLPLIVTRYAGLEAVAYVHMAIRFIEALSFVKTITWRISVAAFAKFQSDSAKLCNAIHEGMAYQVLLVAPMYLMFSFVAPWLIDFIYDDNRWLDIMTVFPYIATGYLLNAVFNLHCSALYVLRRNLEVGMFHVTHVILFATASLILVPQLGVVGYGWGEVIGVLGYFVVYWYARKFIGPIDHSVSLVLTASFCLALFWEQLGLVALSGVGLVFLWPPTWTSTGNLLRSGRQLLGRKSTKANS
jgi:PST family polysaccharide transporter